jgi:hypothetical protein
MDATPRLEQIQLFPYKFPPLIYFSSQEPWDMPELGNEVITYRNLIELDNGVR